MNKRGKTLRNIEKSCPLDEAVKIHRQYVLMGMDIHSALISVTEKIKSLHTLRDSRAYSKQFYEAVQAEITRLNIESSAMHIVIRESA